MSSRREFLITVVVTPVAAALLPTPQKITHAELTEAASVFDAVYDPKRTVEVTCWHDVIDVTTWADASRVFIPAHSPHWAIDGVEVPEEQALVFLDVAQPGWRARTGR